MFKQISFKQKARFLLKTLCHQGVLLKKLASLTLLCLKTNTAYTTGI